jgi:glycosyltransferase involved in cell wall biosynthesis
LRTPVVVNEKCDVLKEHIENSGGGLTFSDYDQFKDAIDSLIKNPGLRDKLSSKGLEYVLNNYTWETVIDKFDMAIKNIKGY